MKYVTPILLAIIIVVLIVLIVRMEKIYQGVKPIIDDAQNLKSIFGK